MECIRTFWMLRKQEVPRPVEKNDELTFKRRHLSADFNGSDHATNKLILLIEWGKNNSDARTMRTSCHSSNHTLQKNAPKYSQKLNACRACSTIIFVGPTNKIIPLWRNTRPSWLPLDTRIRQVMYHKAYRTRYMIFSLSKLKNSLLRSGFRSFRHLSNSMRLVTSRILNTHKPLSASTSYCRLGYIKIWDFCHT